MINLISIIKVGYLTRKSFVKIKYEKNLIQFLHFLLKNGIIIKFYIRGNDIFIFLRYIKNKPLIQDLKIISKKGFRQYITYKNLKKFNNHSGTNTVILSTSHGYLTSIEAANLKIGGELLVKLIY